MFDAKFHEEEEDNELPGFEEEEEEQGELGGDEHEEPAEEVVEIEVGADEDEEEGSAAAARTAPSRAPAKKLHRSQKLRRPRRRRSLRKRKSPRRKRRPRHARRRSLAAADRYQQHGYSFFVPAVSDFPLALFYRVTSVTLLEGLPFPPH